MTPRLVSFHVNGEARRITVLPHRSLLDALHNEAGLTGTKKGCDVGECGSCTVIMNGRPVNACLVLAVEAEGAEIATVEGLQAADGGLHRLQQSFIDCGATQCGFCTPGFLMAAKALLDENPTPTREAIRFAIAGNICRCTGYTKILDAIERAAQPAAPAQEATR